MKRWLMCVLLGMTLWLTGCSQGEIGNKMIVKAMYLDKMHEYVAHLVVLQAQPSADAGDAKEQLRVLTGEGESWFEALEQAQKSCTGTVFHGQNEMLLIGPNLQQEGVSLAANFLVSIDSGRPNMQVWGIDLSGQDFVNAVLETDFMHNLRQLSEETQFKSFLYQILQPEKGFVLPLISCPEEQLPRTEGLSLYIKDKPVAHWDQAKATLAALLMGQSQSSPSFELELSGETVQIQLSDPRFVYGVKQEGEKLVLDLRLVGRISSVTGTQGVVELLQDDATVQQLEQGIAQQMDWLIQQGFSEECDVFSLKARFANYSVTGMQRMKQQGTLFGTSCIDFSSELKIL